MTSNGEPTGSGAALPSQPTSSMPDATSTKRAASTSPPADEATVKRVVKRQRFLPERVQQPWANVASPSVAGVVSNGLVREPTKQQRILPRIPELDVALAPTANNVHVEPPERQLMFPPILSQGLPDEPVREKFYAVFKELRSYFRNLAAQARWEALKPKLDQAERKRVEEDTFGLPVTLISDTAAAQGLDYETEVRNYMNWKWEKDAKDLYMDTRITEFELYALHGRVWNRQ